MEHKIRTQRYDDETSTLFDVTYCGCEYARTGPATLREPGKVWPLTYARPVLRRKPKTKTMTSRGPLKPLAASTA